MHLMCFHCLSGVSSYVELRTWRTLIGSAQSRLIRDVVLLWFSEMKPVNRFSLLFPTVCQSDCLLQSWILNFHRTPVLLTAVARRMTGCAAAYFFDDSGVVGLVAGHGFAQAILRDIYSMAGAALDPGKSQAPAGCRVFLGLSANLALVSIGGLVELWHLEVSLSLTWSLDLGNPCK